MSFPPKAPSGLPPGLKLGTFAGGGPFPRLVAPGIIVGDRDPPPPPPQPLSSSHFHSSPYAQLGLTHVLTRSDSANLSLASQVLSSLLPQDDVLPLPAVTLLLINEQQTLRETVELLVRARVACPRGRVLLLGGEPFVAAAYLMAIEGRDLQVSWRLVTGETLPEHWQPGGGALFREVHGVLSAFARDVEEEGRRLLRVEAEERKRQREESQLTLQPPPKRGRNHEVLRSELLEDLYPLPHRSNIISHPK